MKGSNAIALANIGKALIVSLNPAISEEITSRTLFLALCIYTVKGIPTSKKESFTCWFMMIVPHILPHMLFSLEGGIVKALISFVIYLDRIARKLPVFRTITNLNQQGEFYGKDCIKRI